MVLQNLFRRPKKDIRALFPRQTSDKAYNEIRLAVHLVWNSPPPTCHLEEPRIDTVPDEFDAVGIKPSAAQSLLNLFRDCGDT
jgi:hypothetical protein